LLKPAEVRFGGEVVANGTLALLQSGGRQLRAGTLFLVKVTVKLRLFSGFLLLFFSATLTATAAEFSGLVWKRQGDWHLNGSSAALRLGEAIPPGGLITASGAGAHSLVILLPDGQRLLFECYQEQTCNQGFRVPAISVPPSEAVWATFKGVRDVLLMRGADVEQPFPTPVGRDEDAANTEIIAALEAGKVSIAPALHVLPGGNYKLVVHADDPRPTVTALPPLLLAWNPAQAIATVPIAAPGLYRITVLDESQVPRIEVELLATAPGSVDAETEALRKTRSTVIAWNRTHEGWSLHDFLRAYLQSRAVALRQ
jgi:hypothetical protein